ncbi:hypothetical protein ATANTOWER_001229 [Ataeniobius toweri]|uniref:Uncharacterized protein n=1 Tax=Ataeniobius toweri TaxID=208326 RepID=A0ABU7A9L9_9TELE|nr:hypothetical protein [Ataeniobius toweri]
MQIFYTAIIQFCAHPSLCCLAYLQSRTGPDCNKQSGPQRGLLGLNFPPSQTCIGLRSEKGQLASLQTPHILDTNCSDFYLQVAATDGKNGKNQLPKRQILPSGCFSDEHLTARVVYAQSQPALHVLYT